MMIEVDMRSNHEVKQDGNVIGRLVTDIEGQ